MPSFRDNEVNSREALPEFGQARSALIKVALLAPRFDVPKTPFERQSAAGRRLLPQTVAPADLPVAVAWRLRSP
jgi:hypothetical protein